MPSRILVIDYDLDVTEQIQRTLQEEGYQVLTTVTGQAGIALAELERPNLILLDIDLPDVDGYAVCRALRGNPATAKVPILIHSARNDVSDKVAGFKAGANDYIVKPAAPAELLARIKASLRSDELRLAQIIALWGSKGGVGTTTLAANLAVALHTRTGKRVTLVDASVLGGTLGVMLNLATKHTIADLVPRLEELDSELLASVLTMHSSGVRFLASVPWNKDGSHIEPAEFARVLGWLQRSSDYLVADTAPSLDPSTLAVLQGAHLVVVVLTPEMTSLRNARIFLNLAGPGEQQAPQFLLVANRYPIKGGIPLKEMETALQKKIKVEIPSDEPLVTYSINRGIPLVISHPRSAVAQGFFRLADWVIAHAEKAQRAAPAAGAAGRRS